MESQTNSNMEILRELRGIKRDCYKAYMVTYQIGD